MRITNRSYANPDNESLPDKFHPKLSTGTGSRAVSYTHLDVYKRQAMRLYSAALDLADEHKYDKLAKASLTNLASLYVVSVSYTHLDVYKRQELLSILKKNKE